MRDGTLLMKDAYLVAADAAAQVDSSDKIADVGAGLVEGHMICEITAFNVDDDDELYLIKLQGSSESDFASDIEDLAILGVGATETMIGTDTDSVIGTYKLPFSNERNGTVYRYLRVYTDVTGTVGTGINYTARLEK
jgi:hypothetical protein